MLLCLRVNEITYKEYAQSFPLAEPRIYRILRRRSVKETVGGRIFESRCFSERTMVLCLRVNEITYKEYAQSFPLAEPCIYRILRRRSVKKIATK